MTYGRLWKLTGENKVSLICSRLNERTGRNYYARYLRRKIDNNNFLLLMGDSCDIMQVEDTLESSLYKELCRIVQKFRDDQMRLAPITLSCSRRTVAFDPVIKLPTNRVSSRRVMHKWIPR